MGASAFVSPGVYFREIDLSLYIPNLSSTIVGLVGTFPKGPVNQPTFISNVVAAIETFGSPDPNHLATYALLQGLRFGKQYYVVRVNGSTAISAAVTAQGAPFAASMLGAASGPYVFQADSAPSVRGTNQGATVATIDSTNNMLLISIQGGPQIPVTLAPGTAVTKTAIATAINAAITGSGGTCVVAGTNQIQISTTAEGAVVQLAVLPIANSAYGILGLTPGTYRGTDNNLTLRVVSLDRSSGTPTSTNLDVSFSAGSLTADQVVTALNAAFAGGGPFPAVAANVNGRVQLTAQTAGQDFGLQLTVNNPSNLPDIVGAAGILGLPLNTTIYGRGHSTPQNTLTFSALSSGVWGNQLKVQVYAGSVFGTYALSVISKGAVVERFDNLVESPEATNSALGTRYIVDAVNPVGASKFITINDLPTDNGWPVFGTYTLTGGTDGLEAITEADFVGVVDGQGNTTGLQCFASPERVDVNLLICPGVASAAVIEEMISICETRGDCMCIVDPPLGLTVQGVADWHNGAGPYTDHGVFNSSYAALYWPWGKVFDPTNNVYIWTPPSGSLSSIYAYTDQVSELWFAPAGFNRALLTQFLEVEFSPTQGDRDLLYGNGNAVNPIVKFARDGIAVWGQRTLQRKPSALDRVNVRRLVLYIRKILATTYRYYNFEPDDPTLWRQIIGVTEPRLESIKNRRGLYDYKVVCDETTNTPDLIDGSIARVVIFLKPVKAAEFIQVDLVLTQTGANFDEITF